MTETVEKHYCDNCGKSLKHFDNSLEIVTSKQEDNPWMRLHVKIERHSGVHNESEEQDADLCQKCAVRLLADAVRRVKAGERVSKGVKSTEQEGW